jgi:hypothetical protein
VGDEDVDHFVVDDVQDAIVADAEAPGVDAVGDGVDGAGVVRQFVDRVQGRGQALRVLFQETSGGVQGVRLENDLVGHFFSSPSRLRASAMGMPGPRVPSALRRR